MVKPEGGRRRVEAGGLAGRRTCLGCPNSLVGSSYEGERSRGGAFPVLSWQDCCAACQLTVNCAAWVHSTLPDGTAQECNLRRSVTGLKLVDATENPTITGIMPGWTLPPPPQPSPPYADPPSGPPPPPPPPPLCHAAAGVHILHKHLRRSFLDKLGLECICVKMLSANRGNCDLCTRHDTWSMTVKGLT